MRKFIALLLVFVLLLGVAGCGKRGQTDPNTTQSTSSTAPKPTYRVEELLCYQAHLMAKQLGMVASSNYIKSAVTSPEVRSYTKAYTTIASGVPTTARMARINSNQFLTELTTMVSTLCGTHAVAASGLLAFSDRFYSPVKLESNLAVYLRYNELCDVIVYFTPQANNIISAEIYPLPTDAVTAVVSRYFQGAKVYSTQNLMDVFEKVEQVDVSAPVTGKDTNASYYTQLTKQALSSLEPLGKEDLRDFTSDGELISTVVIYAKAMITGITNARVYDATNYVNNQANQLLDGGAFSQELQQWSRMRCASALPNRFCAQFGTQVLTASNLLASHLNTPPLGATASDHDQTALVLLETSSNITVIVCIYPTGNNTYMYSFSCIPVGFTNAEAMVTAEGITPME